MDEYQDEIARIKELLSAHPEGMSITEIASSLEVNRNSVAKYMDILQIQGAVDGRKMGTSKVYYLSGRLPAHAVKRVCTRPLLIIDKDAVALDTNKSFSDITGIPVERILRQQFDFLPVRITEGGGAKQVLKASLRGTEQRVAGQVTHATGKNVPAALQFLPIVFESGKPGIALIVDEQGAKTAAAESGASFMDMLAMLDDQMEYMVRYTADGIIRYVNDAYCHAAGKVKNDLIGRPFKPLVSPEDAEKIRKHLATLTPQQPVGTIEYRVVMADGEIRYQRWKNRAVFGERGDIEGYYSCGIDITDLVIAQQKLKKAQETLHETVGSQTDELREINRQLYTEIAAREKVEQQLLATQFAMDNAADMVFWVSRNSRVQYANRKAAESLGYLQEDLHDISFADIFPLYNIDRWDEVWEQLKRQGSVSSETSQIRKDGSTFPVDTAIKYLKYHGTEFACCFSRDITDRSRMEQALRQANRKLNLLTSVTRHDIQNKITVLLGFLSRAKKETKEKAVLDYLERQEKAAKEIRNEVQLTRDFKDLGAEPATWQNVRDLVNNAIARQEQDKVTFRNDLPDLELFADSHLERVFDRLFENAIRHGKKVSTVRISLRENAKEEVSISIEDNGIGIKGEDKAGIFELKTGDVRHAGLFIAREILAVTGFSLQETGEAGKGARFEIGIPRQSYREPELPHTA